MSHLRKWFMESPGYQFLIEKGIEKGIQENFQKNFQKGIQEGKREGLTLGIHTIIAARLGAAPDDLDTRLAALSFGDLDAFLLRLAANVDKEAISAALDSLT